jgi:hypothetical protein
MSTQAPDINNILKLLKELETSHSYSVYTPSLDKELTYKQLTTQQLKSLYKSSINTGLLNQEFNQALNSIIKENCLEEIDTSKLTIYDKLLFFVKTRVECISPEINFNLTQNEIDAFNFTVNNVIVNIKDHLQGFIDKKYQFNKETFTQSDCQITCELPNLEVDNKFENDLNATTVTDATTDDFANIVGNTFINEITKYISAIKINDTDIDLLSCDFKTRIEIIKACPASLVKNALNYIENYKQKINELLVINIQANKDIVLTKEIPYDASFYNV